MVELDGIWELYGFKTDPFSTSPLLLYGGQLPITSFYGRRKEIETLLKNFSSSGGSRQLVCGDVGVGKTTLVNYARYKAIQKGHFTTFKEIAVQSNWSADTFILNTLYAFYSTIKLQKGDFVKKETYEKLQALVDLKVDSKAFGVTVGPIGFNYENQTKIQTTSIMALMEFVQEIVTEIRQKTGKDVIIHYNNLERLPEKVLRVLFEDLRDFFQTEHIHFVFVGNLTVYATIQSIPRVSSITSSGSAIILSELSFDEIDHILSIRMKELRIKAFEYTIPYTNDALKTIFDLYGGNIRNILNSLSTAVKAITNEKPVVLDKQLLSDTLRNVIDSRYDGQIAPRAKDVLIAAVKNDEVTNRQIAKNTGIARSNVSTYLKDLEKCGCIYLRRKDGKDKFWSVEPALKWLLLKTTQDIRSRDPNQRGLENYQ
ncbi:winged helix-turn-helix transcriptional regulator [Candidatus Micrarchaeota archaeon]|nr:winged helix-turn-helix transcriptional regulator [Candidatus Micrarchaeota archaeon]